MNSQKGIRRAVIPIVTAGILVALVAGGQTAATAAQSVSITVKPPGQSFSYGDPWGFEVEMTGILTGVYGAGNVIPGESHVSSFDGPYGDLSFYPDASGTAAGWFGLDGQRPPLDAGTYEVGVSVNATQAGSGYAYTGESEPMELEIDPAELTTDVRMIADPSNPDNATITVSLGGHFIDNLYRGLPEDEYPSVPRLPAGSWHLTVADDSGSTVLDRTIEQEADGRPAATVYWTDAAPETAYTVTGSFTPAPDSLQNFAIIEAAPFPYTSPASQRPEPTPSVAGPVEEPLQPQGGPALPIWSILGACLIAFGLMVAIVLLLVGGRRRRPRPADAIDTTKEGETDAAVA